MLRKNITCNVNTMRLACAPGATEALLPHGEAIMCVGIDRSGCHCCDLLSPFSLRPQRRQIAQAEPSTAVSLKSPRSTVEVRIVKHALLCSHALLLATSLLYLFLLSRFATRFCCCCVWSKSIFLPCISSSVSPSVFFLDCQSLSSLTIFSP